MITIIGTWKIGTNPFKHSGYEAVWICWRESRVADSRDGLDLEQAAADFVGRHVLEMDSTIFEL
jgi:hypothetical protein